MTEATQQPVPPADDTMPPATFGLRLLAKLTDILILNVVEITLVCAFPLLQAQGMSGVRLVPWLGGIFVLFAVGYFTVLTSGSRRTPGYRLAGLRVVRDVPPGQPQALGVGRALGRSVLDLVCLVLVNYGVGLIDYLPVAITRPKRALHDLAAGTHVVRTARPRYPALVVCAVGVIAVPAVMVFGVIKPLLLQTYFMPSPSMTPTLPTNTRFLLNKVYYRVHAPERGDIVAFSVPASAASYYPPSYGSDYVKRVIGVPGDELRLANGQVYLWDGGHPRALGEPYVQDGYHGNIPEDDGSGDWFARRRSALVRHAGHWWIQVPPGEYFVLGDNRNDSNDSHIWGFLPMGNITGKVTLVYSPFFQDL